MEYNLALLQSLSNSELASTAEQMTDIPQPMAGELARRLIELVDKGAIPETSEEYRDRVNELEEEVDELEEEVDELRSTLRSISDMADCA
jgi:predicted RNase H-like nuclease (RuvC/YqgF family)